MLCPVLKHSRVLDSANLSLLSFRLNVFAIFKFCVGICEEFRMMA